jgi:hypothetical protein
MIRVYVQGQGFEGVPLLDLGPAWPVVENSSPHRSQEIRQTPTVIEY